MKIDGYEVEVPPGIMVKDAARRAGIRIPGLCDHPELEPYGGCRLCLVEIDGIRGYPSSCTMPVSDGMVVRTDTPPLRDLRQSILQMLLSEHPSICFTCDRAGKCDDIRDAMRKAPQSMGCRYCPKDQRCELQEAVAQIGQKKMELPHLGEIKEVVRSPFFDRDPNLCILCGRCIRACEDRGLGVISFIFRGFEAGIGTAFERPLEDSGCRFCGACVDVCPTGALAERGSKWAGGSRERVLTTCPYCSANCQIGLEVCRGGMLRASPEGSRLCVRGRFGLDFVNRGRIRRPLIKKKSRLVEAGWEEALEYAAKGLSLHRGETFALFTSGILANEALHMADKFARQVMMSEAVAQDVSSLDWGPSDLQSPIVAVGDLAETNPATELQIRSQKPVVVSARRTLLARRVSQWLRPDPGDEALLLGALANALKGRVEAAGCLSSEEVGKAARGLEGASVVVGPDCKPDVKKAAFELADAAGGKLCILGTNCNSRRAAALGMNLKYGTTMKALSSGCLKAAYMAGCNPVRDRPDLAKVISALDLLVVQDLFLTETARLADVVFPAASFAEVEGTFLGPGGRMLQIRPAIPQIGRPDWQIFAELGRRMGAIGFDFRSPKAVQEEMLSMKKPDHSDLFTGLLEERESLKDSITSSSLFSFGSGTRTSRIPDLQYLNRHQPRPLAGFTTMR